MKFKSSVHAVGFLILQIKKKKNDGVKGQGEDQR